MAQYIECEVACAEVDKGDLLIGNNAEFAKEIINRTPTADVVPRSVYDATQHILKGAFERVEQLDELCGELQKAKTDVAREIFEEIETCMRDFEDDDDGYILKKCEFEFFMRELKKKYTEGGGLNEIHALRTPASRY